MTRYKVFFRCGPYANKEAPSLPVRDGGKVAIRNGARWSVYRCAIWGTVCLADHETETDRLDEGIVVISLPD